MNNNDIKTFLKKHNYLFSINKTTNQGYQTSIGDILMDNYLVTEDSVTKNGVTKPCGKNFGTYLVFLDILKKCKSMQYDSRFADFSEVEDDFKEITNNKTTVGIVLLFYQLLDGNAPARELELKSFEMGVAKEWQEILNFFIKETNV